ncbi:MAG: DNA recombination protein RmuC [Solirubrobacterales bacterium]
MPDLTLMVLIGLSIVSTLAVLVLLVKMQGLTQRAGMKDDQFERTLERIDRSIRDEFSQNRSESLRSDREAREEIMMTVNRQMGDLSRSQELRLDQVRSVLDSKLSDLMRENAEKLDQMRVVVDEKLQSTLDQRLGASFQLVSDRLEVVHQGLGEMQALAAGVGDLKRVLTNVKTRGVWGEVQLGALLAQTLAPEQYDTNVATRKGSAERVEFAIRIPQGNGDIAWLPVDAKFPQEDYQRLVEASEAGLSAQVDEASKMLENRLRAEAKSIRDKYLNPPETIDFAIMFLPTESLYAEAAKRIGLIENLQTQYRVLIAGPSTFSALLNSLSLGFRSVAIQRRSSEVWTLLAAVKNDFTRFVELLEKTQKKLQEASAGIENAAKRTRTIEKRLRAVQELPGSETAVMEEDLEAADPDDEVT